MKSRFCIKCNMEITPITPNDDLHPHENMWRGGIVDKIMAGYGSKLDEDVYLIAICDVCTILFGKSYLKLFKNLIHSIFAVSL